MFTRARSIAVAVMCTGMMMFAFRGAPVLASASPDGAQLSADLEGSPIDLQSVGRWFCHDFAYPRIHCYRTANALESAAAPMLSASSVPYVTVYNYPTWAGNYMVISQDYTILALVGWNDRISSFVAHNSESGHFFTDWFYGGTTWYFCCNVQVTYLGGYDNTFSSVHRT